jgi:hypothetical protein
MKYKIKLCSATKTAASVFVNRQESCNKDTKNSENKQHKLINCSDESLATLHYITIGNK